MEEKYTHCLYCKKELTRIRSGRVTKYCTHNCYSLDKPKPFIIKNGYKLVAKLNHTRTDARGYVREHLLVMEEKIGRPIRKAESVHHIDGNKQNNHKDNLLLFKSHNEHLRHEWENNTLRNTNTGNR